MLTLQGVWDVVTSHLMKQGERCTTPDGVPQYRNYRGLCCAVGCLIPDNLYKQDFEGKGLSPLLRTCTAEAVFGEPADKPVLQLLGELQFVHDASPVAEWPAKLTLLKEKYGLL